MSQIISSSSAHQALIPSAWPTDLDPDSICFTVDVEWAASETIDDLLGLFKEHGICATFFVTHAGVTVPGHERGLHPNFRRTGDTWKGLEAANGGSTSHLSDTDIYHHVLETTRSFAPEAKGVRAHCLHHESTLIPLYRQAGLEYECNSLMPLTPNLRPFWREHGMIGLPTYWADHFDLMTQASSFDASRLHLRRPGLKIFALHPNIVYLNASDADSLLLTKAFYHDPVRLRAARGTGRGIRTLLMDIFEEIATHRLSINVVGTVARQWRTTAPWL